MQPQGGKKPIWMCECGGEKEKEYGVFRCFNSTCERGILNLAARDAKEARNSEDLAVAAHS